MNYPMDFLWNMLHSFSVCFILSIQYSFCGASPLHGESVDFVPLERLPFIVSINNKTELRMCGTVRYKFATETAHRCGGSLITTGHILTVAHCLIHYKTVDEVVVITGSTNLRTMADVREVSWWRTYSQHYNITLVDRNGQDIKDDRFDIAIMRLETPVSLDFPLPTISYIPSNRLYHKSIVLVGWGRIEENKKPRNMRVGKAFILGPKKCSSHQPDTLKAVWNALHFCSDISLAQVGRGDSGSPVLYDGTNNDYPNNIVGVVKGMVQVKRKNGTLYPIMDEHVSLYFFNKFIESVKNMMTLPSNINSN